VIVTVLSDLHCEIACIQHTVAWRDVLILAGDNHLRTFFQQHRTDARPAQCARCGFGANAGSIGVCSMSWAIMSPNHFDVAETVPTLRPFLAEAAPNVRILDDEIETFWRLRFIGGTLWTDMDARTPLP